MQGYCMTCHSMKTMINISTHKARNDRFYYKGQCEKCSGEIRKHVKPNETVEDIKTRDIYPKKIEVGEGTSKKLVSRKLRQISIKGGKNGKTIL